jgi:hypothetical protein
MSSTIIYAFVLLIGGQTVFGQVATTVAPTNCDAALFSAATFKFATFIGFNTSSPEYSQIWRDYSVWNNYFVSKFTRVIGSADDHLNVCNGLEQFMQDLGQYRDLCTSLNSFFNRPISLMQAYSFAGMFEQYYSFMCGAGLYTALDANYPCLQRVVLNFRETLAGCIQTYQTNVGHDPANGCRYASDLFQCFATPFGTNCRRTGRIDEWWACESQRRFTRPQFPNCGLSCDLIVGPQLDAYELTHHKMENDQHMYKLPDVYVDVNSDGQWKLQEGKWMSN